MVPYTTAELTDEVELVVEDGEVVADEVLDVDVVELPLVVELVAALDAVVEVTVDDDDDDTTPVKPQRSGSVHATPASNGAT